MIFRLRDDDAFKALKSYWRNLTARPQNVVVATSNRRHLIREFLATARSANEEVHAWDTMQELSFAIALV